jgi:transcriptional regulator with XRE-family HTH domain
MKIPQSKVSTPEQAIEAQEVGNKLARLRLARAITQLEAATRAGLSRNTAYRLEKGDPGIAIGQVIRYLQAIKPGGTLLDLLQENDPALARLQATEQTQRARPKHLSKDKLYDF